MEECFRTRSSALHLILSFGDSDDPMVKCHLKTDDSQTYISSPNLSPGLQTGIVSSLVSAWVVSGSSNFTRPRQNYEFIKLLLHKLSLPHLPFILHTFNSFYWFFHHNISESYYISPCLHPWPLIIPSKPLISLDYAFISSLVSMLLRLPFCNLRINL